MSITDADMRRERFKGTAFGVVTTALVIGTATPSNIVPRMGFLFVAGCALIVAGIKMSSRPPVQALRLGLGI